jgi:bifunctional DNase/RNase
MATIASLRSTATRSRTPRHSKPKTDQPVDPSAEIATIAYNRRVIRPMHRASPALRLSSLPAAVLLAALAWGCTTPAAAPRDEPPTSPTGEGAPPPLAGEPEGGRRDEAVPPADLLTAELATVGWDGLSGAPVVLLRGLGTGQVLPIWIGVAEARAIAMALHSIEPPRPMTHDLMANLLAVLDATLEEVVVVDLRDNTYYGLLKLRVAGEEAPRWIDTRPSDGLALAVRTGAVIRVARKLLDDKPDFQFLAPEGADQVVRLLGMTVKARSGELGEEDSGLVVVAVTGKAERAGLEAGDRIVEVNGKPIDEPVDLLDAIQEIPPTGVLRIQYRRGEGRGEEEGTVEIPLEVAPPKPSKDDIVA